MVLDVILLLSGDKEKVGWRESCYKANFIPFGTKLEPIKHKAATDGPPTIKGDMRIHNDLLYGTTTKEYFPAKYEKQIKIDESIRVRNHDLLDYCTAVLTDYLTTYL